MKTNAQKDQESLLLKQKLQLIDDYNRITTEIDVKEKEFVYFQLFSYLIFISKFNYQINY